MSLDPRQEMENKMASLHHALHLADIQATHNDKEVDVDQIVESAKKFETFLSGTQLKAVNNG